MVVDTGTTKARRVFAEHGGLLRTSKAIRLGIHPQLAFVPLAISDSVRVTDDAFYQRHTRPAGAGAPARSTTA